MLDDSGTSHRDNLEGWGGEGYGRELQEEGTYVYLWLIHVGIWQKTRKFCKAIILQLNKIRLNPPEKKS